MITFPPCKINLGLYVLAKRKDGYHDITTCFYPIPWTDILEIIPAQQFLFSSSGNAIPGKHEDNLCVKAYQLLQKDFDLQSVRMHLHKIIPTGAGLGGGSSDAAYALLMINEIYDLKLSVEQLEQYASRLGSDCPFFIQDSPKFASGRGEILKAASINLKGKFIVVVKPEIHVSTAEAYAGIIPGKANVELPDILQMDRFYEWKNMLSNQFEESVFKKYPVIAQIKKSLYDHGAVYASMSGSGSAVFGLFDKEVDLKNKYPDSIYRSSRL